MAASDKVSPGEQFRPPLAATWNAMVDAGEAFRASQQSQQQGAAAGRRSTDIIKCKNASGSDRRRGEILGAFTNPLTNLEADKLRLAGDAPGEGDHFGILLKATPDGEYGDLQVSGACLALVDITDADHTRASADGSGHVLVSSDDGPIEILYKPEGTGEELCCVRFGGSGGGSRLVRFVMTSDWSSGAAGADFSEMDSAAFIAADTLRDPVSIFTDLEEGSQGLALLQSGKYWAIQAACPNEE